MQSIISLENIENLKSQCIDEELFENNQNLQDFVCPIGLGIIGLQNSIVDDCNHMYCGKCSEKLSNCPVSRKPITKRYEIPLGLKNFLGNQKMKCSEFQKGCKWVGKYEDYFKHFEKECQYSQLEKQCKICKKTMDAKKFDQHLIDNRLEHYEIMENMEKSCKEAKQQNFGFSILYKEVKTSIHSHKLKFMGKKENGWYCDAVTDSPGKICLSGHLINDTRNHINEASLVYLCTEPSCRHAYCLKCVQKFIL